MSHKRRDAASLSLLAIVAAAALAGCLWRSSELRTPTMVGVVTSIDQVSARTYAFHLSTGDVLSIDLSASNVLLPSGGPSVGYLLLSGTEQSGRIWIAGLPPHSAADAPPGCFRLLATGVGAPGWIDLSIGVRLPKAPTFDPGPIPDDQFDLDGVSFCIDRTGQVLSYG